MPPMLLAMAIELVSAAGRAVILPEFGGRLHQLYVRHDGDEQPVLWSPEDPAAYAQKPTHGGCFPMAPWPNRIAGSTFRWNGQEYLVPDGGKPNAIHGRVLNVPWTVVARTARVCEMTAAFDEGWPWQGAAWQRIEMTSTGLRMKLEVRTQREPFPAGCGWHPWFRRTAFGSDDVALEFSAEERYVSADDLPTGELVRPSGDYDFSRGDAVAGRKVDACYRAISGPVELRWGEAALRIEIAAPEPHAMVYTPDFALCVEPQTCAPDAFNLAARGVPGTGFAVAEPGKAVAIESRWSWSNSGR